MVTKEDMINSLLEYISNIPPEEFKISAKAKEVWNSTAAGLLRPTIPPKELGLTYATIKYWEKKNYLLLPTPKETDQWRKFSILEVFWIDIIKKFAKMGCVLDVIVPKLIFAYSNKYKNNETIPYSFETPLYAKDSIDGVRITPVTTFLFHIIEIFAKKSKAALHFFTDRCQFTFESGVDKSASANAAYELMYNTGISISISDIAYGYILEKEKVPLIGQFLSAQEIEILSLLKKDQLKEVTIKLENGTPIIVLLKEKFNITKEDGAKRLKEFLTTPYQEITAITNGGKTIYFERTIKKKLKI